MGRIIAKIVRKVSLRKNEIGASEKKILIYEQAYFICLSVINLSQ